MDRDTTPGSNAPDNKEDVEKTDLESSGSTDTSPRFPVQSPQEAHAKGSTFIEDQEEPSEPIPHERHHSHSSQETSSSSQRTASDVHDPELAHSVSRTQSLNARSRSRSRAQSAVRSELGRDPEIVPRADRRGLLARWSLLPEITEPKDYPRRTKWIITAIAALAGMASPMGTAIVLPALPDIARTFDSPLTVVNLSIAMYMLAMSIFPLWWSSFSETLGRRTIYLASFAMSVVFNALSAVSVNIGMFIAMRVFAGGAAASVQAVGAGTIADIWEVKERGRAMGIFYIGPLCGPLLSPILGGILSQTLGWRSAQWFMTIFGAVLCVIIVLGLPETLKRRTSLAAEAAGEAAASEIAGGEKGDTEANALSRSPTAVSVKQRSRKYLIMQRRAFIDPLRIVLYLQFPSVALSVLYASVTLGSLYVLNISITEAFSSAPYNYSTIIVGLLYLPNSVGYFVASVFAGRWVDYIMHREARKAGRYDEKGRLQFRPEDRMKENAWLGAIMYPAALITYGWCAEYKVSIAGPMVANFFFGIGGMIVFAVVTTMLTEYMPRKSSNGVALNNFLRMIFACIGTLVAEPLIQAIGNGWLFTGLGVICLAVGAGTIWSMKRFGPRWRVTMDRKLDAVMGD